MPIGRRPVQTIINHGTRITQAAGVLLLLLCLFPTLTAADNSIESVTLQLKWKHQFQFAGYYAALEKGFYKDSGLDVTIREHEGKRTPIEVLLAGDANYSVSSSEIVVHRANGEPVVALASIFQHSAYSFLVKADSTIQRIEDFAGRRVMLGSGAEDMSLRAAMKRAGINIQDIKLLPSSLDVNSLLQDETDVFNAYVTDQIFRMKQAGVKGRHILPIHYGIDFYSDILATTEDEIRKHPKRVGKFLQASLKGWEYALANQDEIIDLILKKYNTQEMSYRHLEYEAHTTIELIQPLLIGIGHMNPTRWKQIKDTLEEIQIIKPNSNINGMLYQSIHTTDDWGHWVAENGITLALSTLILYIILLLLLLFKVQQKYNNRTRELAESEQRLTDAQEYANLGHWVLPRDTGVEEWSAHVYEIFGIDQSEPTNCDTFRTIMYEDDYFILTKSLQNSLDTGKEHHMEYRIRRPDGVKRWVECRGRTTLDKNGRPEKISGFVQDITNRKLAELGFKTERDFAENLINMAQVIVLVLDTEGNIVRFNPYMEVVSGYSLDEVKGKNWFKTFLPGHDHEQIIALFKKAISNINTQGNVNKIITKGGTVRDIEWRDKTITDNDDQVIGLLAIGHDITQRKQHEEEQKRLQMELQKAHRMEAMGQLSGGVAHDFNNLLGIIIGNLDMLQDEIVGNGPAMRQCESAIKAALRGSDLTKRLLDFSSHAQPEAKPENINQIIIGMQNMIERSLTSSIKAGTKLNDDLWFTLINSDELEDVLINLAVNARDAMPNGGRFLIETKNTILDDNYISDHPTVRAGEYIKLAITDNGAGIPEEMLERVYEPFFTTKPQGQGTGLGLSMVYGFTQSVGGHIQIESEHKKGTTVNIYLPRSNEIAKSAVEIQPGKASVSGGNETILVVDDEPDLALSTKISLNRLGYRVLTAYNASEALKSLESNPHINLMFSDVIMSGGMNGFDLANEAKRQYPNLKILLASGFTQDTNQGQAKEFKTNMLTKPYRNEEVSLKIRNLLDSTE